MKTKDSRKILIISVILGAALIAAAVGLIISGIGKESAVSSSAAGHISATVTDAATDLPIEGAVIVVAETGRTYSTDAEGRVADISVPLTGDPHFADILPKTWSECTLIVYHEKYIPACVFGVQVTGSRREGPEILMFSASEAVADSPVTYMESPDKEWTRTLMERFYPMK